MNATARWAENQLARSPRGVRDTPGSLDYRIWWRISGVILFA